MYSHTAALNCVCLALASHRKKKLTSFVEGCLSAGQVFGSKAYLSAWHARECLHFMTSCRSHRVSRAGSNLGVVLQGICLRLAQCKADQSSYEASPVLLLMCRLSLLQWDCRQADCTWQDPSACNVYLPKHR